MKLQKKDFVEIEFTGKVKDTNEIFDSNIKKVLESSGLNSEKSIEPKPFIFSLGEGMFLKGVEEFLEGKEAGKYEIELIPEKAFGNRNSSLVKLVPLRVFKEKNLNPIPGILFNFDGQVGKVLSASGGRITVDFNNPMSGKTVIYDINVLRKVEDVNEKAKALIDFLFRKNLDFKIEGKKLKLKVEEKFKPFANLFKGKFKDVLGLELVLEEEKDGKEKEKEEKKSQ